MDKAAHKKLAQAAGPDNYAAGPEKLVLYAYDASYLSHRPQAVVRALDEAQISRVLAVCTRRKIPVVPRGAGSGVTGGALPVAGGVVLDLAGLDRILAINPADQTAVVQPGVVTGDLQAAAKAQGLFYPPDPASADFCTVGGNVAENAGGLRAVKYGVTRDYVLGLKAVLPDGRVFSTGGPVMKNVVGYDLTRLLVGSEGTLAVITEITVRLLPLPEAKATLSAYFHRLEDAASAVAKTLASGIRPVALEFMDQGSLEAVAALAEMGLPAGREAMLLVELDGPPEVLSRQADEVAGLLKDSGGDPVTLAEDQAQAEELWRARRSMGPATRKLASGKLNEDVAVPLGSLADMVRRIQAIAQERGLAIPTFGHAGDGNLHVNVMFDAEDPAQVAQAQEAVSDVFAHTIKLSGTLSGEHGVGLTKLGYVGAQMDPVSLELMRSLKKVFDPAGILNPHKKIPSPQAMGA